MEDFWKSVQTIQAERGADYRAFSLFSATHWAELLEQRRSFFSVR